VAPSKTKHPDTVAALIAQVTGREPRRVSAGTLELLELTDHPMPGETTLVSVGLSAIRRSIYRGLPTAFELIAVTREPELVRDRLAAAVLDELAAAARGDGHTRVAKLPPRGVMYNGVFAAPTAPHLVFSTSLTRIPALTGRHRVGAMLIELLPTVAITDAELTAYDASPRGLIAELEKRYG
jgi:hypothetical protein